MTAHEEFRNRLIEKKRELDVLSRVWRRLNVLVTQDEIDGMMMEEGGYGYPLQEGQDGEGRDEV